MAERDRMAAVKFNVRIGAPREDVFAVFADLPRAPERVKGIVRLEMLTDGPVQKGTRFKETRVMFGKEATETMEVTEFDPPRSYTVGAHSCGMHYVARNDFRTDGDATVVELTFGATPTTFVAKIMAAVMSKMMAGACRKAVEQDFADLKRYIEQESPNRSPA
jgi:uncharacterized membrane protein